MNATTQAGDHNLDGAACMLAGFHKRPGWSSEAHWAADRAFRSIDSAILASMLMPNLTALVATLPTL
jgi:hypothetical protein